MMVPSDVAYWGYSSSISVFIRFTLNIFSFRWDLLNSDHPFFKILEPESAIHALYLVAGSDSWDPVRNEARFEEIYKIAISDNKITHIFSPFNIFI